MSNIAGLDKKIYLDHAASTPIDPGVLEKMMPYFGAAYDNPSSLHSSGRRAAQVINEARKKVADVIGALPEEIIFTGSGSESDNLAILGVARANRAQGNHIIISAIEHKAVLKPARELRNEGFEITVIPVKPNGIIDVQACIESIRENTILISVMYANNEIGTIQPVKKIAEGIQRHKSARTVQARTRSKLTDGGKNDFPSFPLFHTDACQAVGFLDLNVRRLGVDLMTLNGAKIYGPKGVGSLYVRNGVRLSSIILGGEQEKNLRAGTESVPLIVGFGEALVKSEKMRITESKRLTALRDYFIEKLLEKIPGAVLNGDKKNRLPNNVHISVPCVEGESMLLLLDSYGIEVSTGSACSAFDLKPSHVLLAIGQNPDLVHGSVRFSFGRSTTKKKLNSVLSIFLSTVKKLTSISAAQVLQKTNK